jgi:hypothetical protein
MRLTNARQFYFESDAKGSFETETGGQVGGGETVGRGTEKTRKEEVTM